MVFIDVHLCTAGSSSFPYLKLQALRPGNFSFEKSVEIINSTGVQVSARTFIVASFKIS